MESLTEYWCRIKDNDVRRKSIFNKMPQDWEHSKKLLHTAIALDHISNNLKNRNDKFKAKRDSEYYFNQLKELNSIGR